MLINWPPEVPVLGPFTITVASAVVFGNSRVEVVLSNTITGKVPLHRPGGPAQDAYAYGFEDQRVNGVRIVGHNCGTPGYEGQLDICPDTGAVVVILANQDRVLAPAIQRAEAVLTGSAA